MQTRTLHTYAHTNAHDYAHMNHHTQSHKTPRAHAHEPRAHAHEPPRAYKHKNVRCTLYQRMNSWAHAYTLNIPDKWYSQRWRICLHCLDVRAAHRAAAAVVFRSMPTPCAQHTSARCCLADPPRWCRHLKEQWKWENRKRMHTFVREYVCMKKKNTQE